MIIAVVDTLTAILAGTLVFSILGYLSFTLNEPIADVINGGGVELAFISYPTAVASFDTLPQFFAAIFFLMLIALGFGSVIGTYSNIVGVLCDQFGGSNRIIMTVIVLSLAFLSSLVYVTPGGQQILYLVDFLNSDIITPSIVILEVFAVSYVYGIDNLTRDVNFMLDRKFGTPFKFLLGILIPWTLVGFFIYFFVNFPDLNYDGVPFPESAIAAMWMLLAVAWAAVPITMVYCIVNSEMESFYQKFYDCCQPSDQWGPQDINEKTKWLKL